MTAAAAEAAPPGPPAAAPGVLSGGVFRYIATTCWIHQLPLVGISVVVFLIEVAPLELQRRIVNDVVKHRKFEAVLLLCAGYLATVLVQGSAKLGLNLYRSWVGEQAKRDLRHRIHAAGGASPATFEVRGTAISMIVAEVEPIGNFVGASVSEPLLQAGVLATVIAYVIHIDLWMGVIALLLFAPQVIFVPAMQHAMNRRTRARVWLLRRIGTGILANTRLGVANPADAARVDRVFALDMGICKLKFTMNFLMNLCTHLQIIAALLLGSWRVLHGNLEIGGVVAFISGIGRLIDPWGDLVNYFRDLSVTEIKFDLLASAVNRPPVEPGGDSHTDAEIPRLADCRDRRSRALNCCREIEAEDRAAAGVGRYRQRPAVALDDRATDR
jgi:ABC-type bacteriocin/lantibiotic exporter with double-glycine peptidase domain